MKKAVLILALTSQVFASEDLIQQLATLNNQNQDCSAMSNDDLAQQCAHAVCGSPEKISLEVNPQNAEKYLSPENKEKLKSLDLKLRDYYRKIENDDKQYIRELETRIQSPSFQDVSKWKDDDFSNFLPYFISDIDLHIDYQVPASQRTARSNTPVTHPHYRVHKEIIENLSLKDHPFFALNLGIIGAHELRPILNERLIKIQDTLRTQKKTITFNFDELQFGLNTGSKKDSEIVALFMKLETELKKQNVSTGKSLCQEECKKAVPQVLKNFNFTEFKKEHAKSNTLNIEDKVAFCKSSFVNANIENTRFEEFQKIWPEVKNGYYKNVFPKYSEHSQGLLKNYFDTGINFVSSGRELSKFPDIKDSLNFRTLSYQKESNASLVARAVSPAAFSSEDPIYECPIVQGYPLLWDAFTSKEVLRMNPGLRFKGVDTAKDNILISPFACEHADMGKGVIAHEIGHAVTHVMSREGMSKASRKSFENFRKCATKQWKSNPKVSISFFKDDKLYTEEDTADLMSYMAINDQKTLFSCGVLYPTAAGYQALNIRPPLNDMHTSGVVRLLREIQYKAPERMPSTCQEILNRNKDMFGQKCF